MSGIKRLSSLSGFDEQKKSADKSSEMERIQGLRLIDDIMFAKVIENKEACQEIVSTILKDDFLIIEDVKSQTTITNLHGRGIRADAVCTLGDGTKCNVEVQVKNANDDVRRARYNASCLTAQYTEPGSDFSEIVPVCVIYITAYDPFQCGKMIYHARTVIEETGCALEDGLSYVFVNTKVKDTTSGNLKISRLMELFMECRTPRSSEFGAVARRMSELKESEKGVRLMGITMEELRAEGRKEGRKEGRAEGIIRMGRKFGLSEEDIIENLAEELHITKEQAYKIFEHYISHH